MSQAVDIRNCIDPGVKYLIAERKFNTPTRTVVFRRQSETNTTGARQHATIPRLAGICQDWVDFHYLERRRKMRIVDTLFLPHIDRNLLDNLYTCISKPPLRVFPKGSIYIRNNTATYVISLLLRYCIIYLYAARYLNNSRKL